MIRKKDMLAGMVLFSFYGRWWGSTVHVIHLNTDSRRWDWLEYRGPFSLITNLACYCGCIIYLTSPPWVPFLMCFCVLLSSGRLGPARAEVGLGFALLGWFRRFRPPPPPLVWFRVRRPSLFFFPCLFGVFARFGLGVSCWCLLFPSSLAFPSSRPG